MGIVTNIISCVITRQDNLHRISWKSMQFNSIKKGRKSSWYLVMERNYLHCFVTHIFDLIISRIGFKRKNCQKCFNCVINTGCVLFQYEKTADVTLITSQHLTNCLFCLINEEKNFFFKQKFCNLEEFVWCWNLTNKVQWTLGQ